jgi:hypothetical protein
MTKTAMTKTTRHSPIAENRKDSPRAARRTVASQAAAGEISDADLDTASGGIVGPCNMPARSRPSST